MEANELTEPGITLRVLPDNGMGLPTLPPLVGLPEGQVGSTALYFQVTKVGICRISIYGLMRCGTTPTLK